jgi:hypothetical protein
VASPQLQRVTSRPSPLAHIGEDLMPGMSGDPVMIPVLHRSREQPGVADLHAGVQLPLPTSRVYVYVTRTPLCSAFTGRLCQPGSLPYTYRACSSSTSPAHPHLASLLANQPLAPPGTVLPLVLGSTPPSALRGYHSLSVAFSRLLPYSLLAGSAPHNSFCIWLDATAKAQQQRHNGITVQPADHCIHW